MRPQITEENPSLVSYLYDPVSNRAGQVVPEGGGFVAQVDGKRYDSDDPEEAIAAAWRMIERRSPLPQLVPVVKRGGAA